MLTKEQIENFRITRRASPELTEDLCRLALLGLERDERAERIGRAVLAWCAEDDRPRTALLYRAVADAMEDEA